MPDICRIDSVAAGAAERQLHLSAPVQCWLWGTRPMPAKGTTENGSLRPTQ